MEIKRYIKMIPGAIPAYVFLKDREAFHADRRKETFFRAVQDIIQIHSATELPPLLIAPDGVWFMDQQGIQWLFDLPRNVCAMGLEMGRPHEPRIMRVLSERLKPNQVFCDVGANVGYFSVQLAKSIDGLRVHSFEPVGSTSRLLKKNVERNGLANRVSVYQIALGEKAGEMLMTCDQTTGNHLLGEGGAGGAVVEKVRIATLDALLAEVGCPHVDLIKCDIEGAEMLFLRGAQGVLQRDRPDLVIEVEQRWLSRMGSSPEEVFRFLKDLGYAFAPLHDDVDTIEFTSDPIRSGGTANNFLCVWRQSSGSSH